MWNNINTDLFHDEGDSDGHTEAESVHGEECLSDDFEVVVVIGISLVLEEVMNSTKTEHDSGVNPERAVTIYITTFTSHIPVQPARRTSPARTSSSHLSSSAHHHLWLWSNLCSTPVACRRSTSGTIPTLHPLCSSEKLILACPFASIACFIVSCRILWLFSQSELASFILSQAILDIWVLIAISDCFLVISKISFSFIWFKLSLL